jgi:hypothetical protein
MRNLHRQPTYRRSHAKLCLKGWDMPADLVPMKVLRQFVYHGHIRHGPRLAFGYAI